MKIKLTKITSTHNNVRTETMIGEPGAWPPEIGQEFMLVGEGLADKTLSRIITTTPITDIFPDESGPECKGFAVKTLNSTYRLEVADVIP